MAFDEIDHAAAEALRILFHTPTSNEYESFIAIVDGPDGRPTLLGPILGEAGNTGKGTAKVVKFLRDKLGYKVRAIAHNHPTTPDLTKPTETQTGDLGSAQALGVPIYMVPNGLARFRAKQRGIPGDGIKVTGGRYGRGETTLGGLPLPTGGRRFADFNWHAPGPAGARGKGPPSTPGTGSGRGPKSPDTSTGGPSGGGTGPQQPHQANDLREAPDPRPSPTQSSTETAPGSGPPAQPRREPPPDEKKKEEKKDDEDKKDEKKKEDEKDEKKDEDGKKDKDQKKPPEKKAPEAPKPPPPPPGPPSPNVAMPDPTGDADGGGDSRPGQFHPNYLTMDARMMLAMAELGRRPEQAPRPPSGGPTDIWQPFKGKTSSAAPEVARSRGRMLEKSAFMDAALLGALGRQGSHGPSDGSDQIPLTRTVGDEAEAEAAANRDDVRRMLWKKHVEPRILSASQRTNRTG